MQIPCVCNVGVYPANLLLRYNPELVGHVDPYNLQIQYGAR